MTNGTPTPTAPTTTQHVVSVATGVIVGGLAAAVAVAAAPVILPAIGLAAVATGVVTLGGALPWLGAAVGGYLANKKSNPAG